MNKSKKKRNIIASIIVITLLLSALLGCIYAIANDATQIYSGSITLENVKNQLIKGANGYTRRITYLFSTDTKNGGRMWYTVDTKPTTEDAWKDCNKITFPDNTKNGDNKTFYTVTFDVSVGDCSSSTDISTQYYLHVEKEDNKDGNLTKVSSDFSSGGNYLDYQGIINQDGTFSVGIGFEDIDRYGDVYKMKLYTGDNIDYSKEPTEKDSIQTIDAKENIKVLNVYPDSGSADPSKANSVSRWLNTDNISYDVNDTLQKGWGRSVIETDSIGLRELNDKSEYEIKNKFSDYDVIVFGTWDNNGFDNNSYYTSTGEKVFNGDISSVVASEVKNFKENGGAIIFGHDTFNADRDKYWRDTENEGKMWNFNSIAYLAGITLDYKDTVYGSNNTWWDRLKDRYNGGAGSIEGVSGYGNASISSPENPILSQIKIVEQSNVLNFPWKISSNDNILRVPATHTVNQVPSSENDIPIRFESENYRNSLSQGRDFERPQNFYLTISKDKKAAMVQTGHSNANASVDEQKLWTNLIFYLAHNQQKYDNIEFKALDKDKPIVQTNNWGVVKWSEKKAYFNAKDYGTQNSLIMETSNYVNSKKSLSNVKDIDYTSGIKSFHYYFSDEKYFDYKSNNLYFYREIYGIDDWETHLTNSYDETNSDSISLKKKDDGTYYRYVYVATEDNKGNISDTVRVDLLADTNSDLQLNLSKSPNNEWTNGDVTISAKATDTIEILNIYAYLKNNVASSEPTIMKNSDNANTMSIECPVIKNDTYKFNAHNIFGASTGDKTITVNEIDKDNPSIDNTTLPSSQWTNKDVDLAIKCNDSLSGVYKALLYKDNTFLFNFTKQWAATKPSDTVMTKNVLYDKKISVNNGSYANNNYKLKVFDNAQNSTEQTFNVKIDKKVPDISNLPSSNWTKGNVAINIKANENTDESGLKILTLYKVNNDNSIEAINTKLGSKTELKTDYTQSTEGIFKYRIKAVDRAGNESVKDFTLNIDKTAPTIDSATITNDFNKFSVSVTNVYDHELSGTDSIRYVVKKNGVQVKEKIVAMSDRGNNTTTFTKDELGAYGVYTVDIYTLDKVGNTKLVKTLSAEIFNPTVQETSLQVTRYDYHQMGSNDYWIKQGNLFGVQTVAAFPSNYTSYPDETQVCFGMPGYTQNYSPSAWATINATGYRGATFLQNFKLNNINSYAIRVNEDNKKKLKYTHTIQALQNNKDYLLYSSAKYANNQSAYKNSNVYIKTDGDAPKYSSDTVIDRQENTLTIRISNIKDTRSGFKSLSVKAWTINNGIKEYEHDLPSSAIKKIDNSTYEFTINRSDFGGNRRGYHYQFTLTDNVGNSKSYNNDPKNENGDEGIDMLQYNLTANRIDFYDEREQRYVTQLISGKEYYAVVNYSNTGDLNVNSDYNVQLNADNSKVNVAKGVAIKKGETKDIKIKFTAGDENLKGQQFEGIVDSSNSIDEINENDNKCLSKAPYSSDRSDTNPPTIPPKNTDGKPSENVPIITIKLDLVCDYVNILDYNTESDVELIVGDTYKAKMKVKNDSSLNIKYLDIKNTNFDNGIYYDNTLIDKLININDIAAGETQIFTKEIVIPSLPDNVTEAIKQVKGVVDVNNAVYETNEDNNIKVNNKTVYALKIKDYRITDIVNPISTHNYPIYTQDMPVIVKTGYNVTLQCNVVGKADNVIANVTDSKGNTYPVYNLTKIQDVSKDGKTEYIYEYTITVPQDLPEGTVIKTELIASKGTATYNYNEKEHWSGETLKIAGNFKEDIVVHRQY